MIKYIVLGFVQIKFMINVFNGAWPTMQGGLGILAVVMVAEIVLITCGLHAYKDIKDML